MAPGVRSKSKIEEILSHPDDISRTITELEEGGTENFGTEEGQAFHTRHVSEPLVARHLFPWFSAKKKGSQEGEGAEEDGQDDTKEYLNGLVAASTAQTSQQLGNIAFIKTHKTASTTLAALLFRYARRHNLKLAHFDGHGSAIPLIEAVHQTQRGGKGRCDIMHYHVSPFGQYNGSWKDAEKAYRQILRESEAVNLITVMREPRSHLLSYYYYYIQPQTKGARLTCEIAEAFELNAVCVLDILDSILGDSLRLFNIRPGEQDTIGKNLQKSIVEFLTEPQHAKDPLQQHLFNPLSAEFGVKKKIDLDYMLKTGLPNLTLVILTEQFDESLMVMRRLLGWEMMDMTYSSMMKTKSGSRRFDGKPLVDSPHFEDLPEHVQKIIDNKTELDRILYAASEKEYQKRRDTVAQYLEADLAEFQQLQDVIKTYLIDNPSSKANVMYHNSNVYRTKEESPMYEF